MRKSEAYKEGLYKSVPNKGHLEVQIKFKGKVSENVKKKDNKYQCRNKTRYYDGF